MDFPNSTKLFSLDNSKGVCAARSMSWLTLSLLDGNPKEKAGWMGNDKSMEQIQTGTSGRKGRHQTAGSASVSSAPNVGGMEIVSTDKSADITWSAAMTKLAALQGFHYLTMRYIPVVHSKLDAAHAMAYFRQGSNIWYLEPESGLYKFSAANTFTQTAAHWYQTRTGVNTASAFSIYNVKLPA
jgi:hypothetical protein